MIGFGQFLPIKKNGNDVKQCDDGGFIVAGYSTSADSTSTDAYLLKTDRDGNLIWEKRFGGGNNDFAQSVQICDDGGFIVAGSSGSLNVSDAYLFKTDRNGNLLWEKKFGKEKINFAQSVQICDDGGFILAGSSGSLNDASDAYLFKTDNNGNLLWEKKFGKRIVKIENRASSVQICDDGGFIIAGLSRSSSSPSAAYLFKTDSNGNLLWEKKFDELALAEANSVQICDDGGFIVTGESSSGHAYLLKTDGSGRKLWKKIFSLNTDIHSGSSASSVQICSDNGYVIIGTHLIKTTANGEVYESTLMEKITSFVESKVNTWQAKGEFEKTPEYQKRVTQSTRNTKIESLQAEALVYFKKEYQKQINFKTITLNMYDADNEVFLLDPFPLKPFLLAVPISEAPYFKQNFNSSNFSNVDFIINNQKFILSHVDLLVGDNTYTYDISDDNIYTTTTFNYNFDKIDIDIDLNEDISISDRVNRNINLKIGKSSVDVDIPKNKKVNNRFALVIGNEDYTSFQRTLNKEQNVDYAENDATVFKKYCLNTLGVKEDNMIFLLNATAGQMSQEIDLISKILSKLGNEAELIVYYAGHGYPDELTKIPYLIPVDVSAANLSSAIKLSDIYLKLSETKASKISIFLDACFTGGGRNSGLVSSRGIKVKPKEGSLSGNMVVFSASSGDQSSLPYHKEAHGMFTYYLLKKLQETNGNISMGELLDYLDYNVSLQSLKENKKEQDPSLNVSQKVINDWRNWRF